MRKVLSSVQKNSFDSFSLEELRKLQYNACQDSEKTQFSTYHRLGSYCTIFCTICVGDGVVHSKGEGSMHGWMWLSSWMSQE